MGNKAFKHFHVQLHFLYSLVQLYFIKLLCRLLKSLVYLIKIYTSRRVIGL